MKADSKVPTVLKRVILFLLSWMTVAAFGIGTLSVLFGAVMATSEGQLEDADSFVILLLAVLIFMVTWLSLYAIRQKLFIKYARWALLIGAMVTAVITVWSMLYTIDHMSSSNVNSSTRCTTLASKLLEAQSATVPIATNLGSGTAFAIDGSGTLLTAYHVIEGAERVFANYVSGEAPITIQATAPEFDIALLKIDQPTPVHLTLTTSYAVGDELYVYGYPNNTFSAGQPSLSSGVLSRVLSEEDMRLNSDQAPAGLKMIQTDAAINPGNSGGPLINKCGVVGVVQSISDASRLHDFYGVVSEQGIGYAISSDTVASRFSLPLNISEN